MYSHFRWFLSTRISFLNCASWFPFSVHYGSRKLCTMVPDFCAFLFAEGCALLFPDYKAQKNLQKKFKKYFQFGFTGTPIFPQNALGAETTASVFGRELHSYVI